MYSIIFIRKSRGPKTDPCGTPEITAMWLDLYSSNVTYWVPDVRNGFTHAMTVLLGVCWRLCRSIT